MAQLVEELIPTQVASGSCCKAIGLVKYDSSSVLGLVNK